MWHHRFGYFIINLGQLKLLKIFEMVIITFVTEVVTAFLQVKSTTNWTDYWLLDIERYRIWALSQKSYTGRAEIMDRKSCVQKRLIENTISKTQCDLILLWKKHFLITQTERLRNTFGEHFLSSRYLTLRHAALYFIFIHTYIYTHTENCANLHTDLLLLPRFH